MKQSPIIAPSLLAANFAHLGRDAKSVLAAGAQWLHFDVMDNNFVPNLSIGPMVCQALRDDGITAPIDVHLMVNNVENLIHAFAKAGATYITIHAEATPHVDRHLQQIRDLGCKAGLAFNPSTPIAMLENVLDKLDLILIMSVNPGFGGQKFIPQALAKIQHARQLIDQSGFEIRLSADGGINLENIQTISEAGADTFVAGYTVFKAENKQKAIEMLLSLA
ncbi:MAG: ribulose-phosphate 3-epimerase [Gammaproteobacteria bacterium]|nr:ribulose-phosphate 3-epimerase [Gammaproteobacteria bacterium]